jgi:hypothetical protein
MSVTKTKIQCTLDVPGKGVIYFRYHKCDSLTHIEFETNSEELILLGKTAGKTYSYIPNMKGVYVNIVGTPPEEVLNAEAMTAVRNSAKDLPDKLKECLGL